MDHLHDNKLKNLAVTANRLRQDVIEMLTTAGSGHSAGPLGMADIFAALYFHALKHDPKNPDWPDRDRLVLSNGHICPILYAALARAGYFPVGELSTLRKINSRLQGHPHRTALPGCETTSGPLGSGLSQSVGMAIAARLDNKKYRIYCMMSDGELQEGNTWEAVMMAGKLRLNNIVAIIDRNNIQIDGFTEDVMPLEPLRQKFESFNWHAIEIDGHSFEDIIGACAQAKAIYERPTVVIAHTIPGKGVSFMENNYRWHGNPPDIADVEGAPPKGSQAREALRQLREQAKKIAADYA